MISLVVLAILASACALPITPEEQITTGIEGITQTLTGIPLTQTIEKTGLQGAPETYTPTGQVQPEKSSGNQQYTGQTTEQQLTQVEKTGIQTPTQIQTGQTLDTTGSNTPVTKIENVPVNVEQVQAVVSETPVLLPVQPLTGGNVLPVVPVGPVPRPVIVPAEAIASGRVIIMSMPIEPIEQRTFQQEVVVNPENYVPVPQVQQVVVSPVQGQVVEPNQQPYFVQPVQTQVGEQTPVRQTVETVPQVQSVPVETTVKQGSEYVPVNPQLVDPSSVQQQTVQGQSNEFRPIVVQSVQKQGLTQTTGVETTQQQQQLTTQQGTEKRVPYEPTSCGNAVENQQQVYNVQPNQNQVSEKTGESNLTPTNTIESQQQQQQTYQGSEKQFQVQTPVESQQVNPQQQQQQQQVYSLQPQVPEQVVSQVPQQQQQQQQQQELKTTEVEQQQQQVSADQPQQVVNYQFGDRIPQQENKNPVQQ